MATHRRHAAAGYRLAAAILLVSSAISFAPTPARGEPLTELTSTMLLEVKRLRGLEPKATVGFSLLGPEELRSLVGKRIREEYTDEQLTALQRFLALTGLIPPDYDLVDRYVTLVASQALGFYDFRSATFLLSTKADASIHAPVVLHELTHVLQDQHFHVYKRLKAMKDDEDARTALQALIEGEAMAVMLELSLQMEAPGRPFYTLATDDLLSHLANTEEAFKDDPPVMRDFIYFPYEAGLPFIKAVRRRMPWSGVDRLYDALPASTEQVLHPERLLVNPDAPRPIQWPGLPIEIRGRWRRLDDNVLGEFGAYLLVKPIADEIEAREAAAGWGGDRYLVLEEAAGSSRAVALFAFVWDTERDAEEFAEAYRRQSSIRTPVRAIEPVPGGRGWIARRAHGVSAVERRGDRVLIMEGIPPEELEAFGTFGWSAIVAPPPTFPPPPTKGLALREDLRRRAESAWKRGDLDKAAPAARKAVALSAGDAEARYLLGTILAMKEETFAEGLEHLTHATTLDQSFGPARLELGRLLKGLGLSEEARVHLDRARAAMPDHQPTSLAYAGLLLEAGEAEAAREALDLWARERARNPELQTLLGRAALARGERRAARGYLNAALLLNPSSAEARLALGSLERKEGNFKAAEKHFQQASVLDPEGAAALVALADLYRDHGLRAEAEATYNVAVARDTNDPVPPTSLARLALMGGDQASAEAWFTQALAADPRWRPALEGLKTIYAKDGRSVKRLEGLLERPAGVDETVRKAVRAGWRCLERGLFRRARLQFEKAAALDREHSKAWVGLGRVHEREERLDLAAVAYLKALESPDPLAPAVRDRLLQWVATRRPANAFGPMVKRFIHATDDGERQRAALALGVLGDRRAVPLLLENLRPHRPTVQAAVAEALGLLGDPAAEEALSRLAAKSQDSDVRAASIRALERLRERRAR